MELDDAVIEEAGSRGGQLLVGKLVKLAEKHHDTAPGVPQSLVEDYLDALAEDSVDGEQLREQLRAHLADDREAPNKGAVYEVGDGRVSGYPAAWHERLDPDDSLAAYVAVMTETADLPKSAASSGVSKDDLLEAAAVLSDRSREDARAELRDLRGDGVLVADADQHPRAGVTLAEDTEFEKEQWDKPDFGERSTE
ncbi:hypothetical protein [Halobacterium jilantaiense]|uniref:Uncharacterized protein n=1 Tax=Halobacterium jilantaiense TaxID=355548 RepID=A0A1I0P0B8_9EURY|nr:hypothetical protein [Halobacterium jilantaiense]SEW07531.1 hypothetical protein SAMN04487945_1291 [Halobacterium jilantaiense]